MPSIDPPQFLLVHDISAPTFHDISKIVHAMRSGSPLDGISVIMLKRCPILLTHLTSLVAACWKQKYFPLAWRRATVSLIYKKGNPADPQNFRPIALQPVLGKIFNSCIRNRLWGYIKRNKTIDMIMQKGFWPGVDSVNEHIELLRRMGHG